MKWDNSERGIWLAESATSKDGSPVMWKIEITDEGAFRCVLLQGSLNGIEGLCPSLDSAKEVCEVAETRLIAKRRSKRMTEYGPESDVWLLMHCGNGGDGHLLSDWTDEDLAKLGLMRKPCSGMSFFACLAALNKITEMSHTNHNVGGECARCLAEKALAEIGKTE